MTRQQSKQYQVAIYCRLSRDDGTISESSSISTQREMLTRYVREQGWKLAGEYIDDGYSGVTFDRPDFKRMIADIEDGKINCVITKDLSRLGRNYLESGAYIEIFFPEHNVRYIALNDGVDTITNSDSGMDITPFKNLLNDMYARDISKKVKSAKRTRTLQGKFMGVSAPYGYKKDPLDKNHLIIDEDTAPIVRRIFDLAKQGLGVKRIQHIMTNEHLLRPGAYSCKHNGNYERFFADNEESLYFWSLATVRNILYNPVYAGHVVGHKRSKVSVKSKKIVTIPPEEWLIAENVHEAIVSQEDWEFVQRLIKSRRRTNPGNTGYDNIFVGIIKCEDCGWTLLAHPENRHKKPDPIDNIIYYCSRYAAYGKSTCSFHKIEARELHRVVLEDIQNHVALALQDDKKLLAHVLGKVGKNELSEAEALKSELLQAKKRLVELDRLFVNLYEDRLAQKISERNHTALSIRYEDEQFRLDGRISVIKNRLEASQSATGNAEVWVRKIKEFDGITELSAPLLNSLIDRITVSEAKKIDGVRQQDINIYYKFIGCISDRTDEMCFLH